MIEEIIDFTLICAFFQYKTFRPEVLLQSSTTPEVVSGGHFCIIMYMRSIFDFFFFFLLSFKVVKIGDRTERYRYLFRLISIQDFRFNSAISRRDAICQIYKIIELFFWFFVPRKIIHDYLTHVSS